MPSQLAPPVLHELAGWSPYQQHTSAARVIESPIAAMLIGAGGAACAVAAPPARASSRATTTVVHRVLRRMMRLLAIFAGLRSRSSGVDVAEHDAHDVIGGVGSVVLAVQAYDVAVAEGRHGVAGARRHRQQAVY